MHGLNQEFLYSSVDIFRMHGLNQEYLYSSVVFSLKRCVSLSKSLTKSIYTLDIVGKILSSMDGYSLLNIAHAYLFCIVEGISRYYVRNMSR